jgi:hypothetical protein
VPLAVAWAIVLAGLLALVPRHGGFKAMAWDVRRARAPTLLSRVAIGIALVLLVIALAAPPNTWDALTYHMPRVLHWVQNRSLAFYASNNGRQIHLSPGAEYLILHFQLLAGSDRFADCVQWSAMAVSLLGVSWIARGLGAGVKGQALAALLCATIPMGIFQATSAQNDYAAAAWMVCFVAIGMELARWPQCDPHSPRTRLALAAAMGASLGLALLTKATAYILLPPLVLWLGLAVPLKFRQRIVAGAVMVVVACLINLGFFARNFAASGKILGPGEENVDGVIHRYDNEQINARVIASNVIRNVAIQFQLPWDDCNAAVERLVARLHEAIGADPSDPRTTLTNQSFGLGPRDSEDGAQAIIVMVLTVAAVATLKKVPSPTRWRIAAYFGCVVVAFLLFCAYLKWQPWHTRLHLPLLVLLIPAIAAVIDQGWPRAIAGPVAVVALIAAIPALLANPTRPLLGSYSVLTTPRLTQYFASAALYDEQAIYERVARQIAERGCQRIALKMTHDDREYLLWVALKPLVPAARIRHVGVVNYTKALEDREKRGDDCAVVIFTPGQAVITVRFPGESSAAPP